MRLQVVEVSPTIFARCKEVAPPAQAVPVAVAARPQQPAFVSDPCSLSCAKIPLSDPALPDAAAVAIWVGVAHSSVVAPPRPLVTIASLHLASVWAPARSNTTTLFMLKHSEAQ